MKPVQKEINKLEERLEELRNEWDRQDNNPHRQSEIAQEISKIDKQIERLKKIQPDSEKKDAKSIILIEDNEDLGEVTVDFLQAEGYQVTWLKDRKTANSYLEENICNYSAVVSDFNVPSSPYPSVLAGFVITKQICEDNNIPLLLCSSETWGVKIPCPHDNCVEKLNMHKTVPAKLNEMVGA